MTKFIAGLLDYLNSTKPKFGEIIKQEKVLTDEAQAILKEGITEYKKTFLVST